MQKQKAMPLLFSVFLRIGQNQENRKPVVVLIRTPISSKSPKGGKDDPKRRTMQKKQGMGPC